MARHISKPDNISHKDSSATKTSFIEFDVKGMTCTSCESIIEENLSEKKGIKSVKSDFRRSLVKVGFDSSRISGNDISKTIEGLGYSCRCKGITDGTEKESSEEKSRNKDEIIAIIAVTLGIFAIISAAYLVLDTYGISGQFANNLKNILDAAESTFTMSGKDIGAGTILLLLLAGFLTSFHCIAMCGGFVISYTTDAVKNGDKPNMSHLRYGAGKTISYTVIGAIFGLIGSVFAFTPGLRGSIAIIAGIFLIIYGLNMLGLFLFFRRFHLKLPHRIQEMISAQKEKRHGPFIVGLLNGLMIACGPLQAIYVLAAGTGSILKGAEVAFFFGLGTLPLLLGFGAITTMISSRFTHKILKISGVIVIVLGLFMMNSGLVLTGHGIRKTITLERIDPNAIGGETTANNIQGIAIPKGYALAELKDNYQTIRMNVTSYGWEPDRFIIYKDIPVKWIIDGQEITSCNNAIQVPAYDLEFNIRRGEQTIEFTPTTTGNIQWSCWMGMIPGQFIVIDKSTADSSKTSEISAAASSGLGTDIVKKDGCGCSGMRKPSTA